MCRYDVVLFLINSTLYKRRIEVKKLIIITYYVKYSKQTVSTGQ